MKNLYDLNSNSNHVKFFKWMWGIDPSIRYKTMCPYFWQYLGSIIILPFIILVKLVKVILDPIDSWIQEIAERDAKIYVARLMEEYENAVTNEDFYKISKRKCWKKYRNMWGNGEAFFTELIISTIRCRSYWYEDELRKAKILKKQNFQKHLDNFKYGKVGTFLSYVLGASVVFLVGYGIYVLLHLFTWNQFVNFLVIAGKIALFAAVLLGVWWIFFKSIKLISCDTRLANVVFWKPIGRGIVSFFKLLWQGIVMFFDMIKNIYKKSCPIIHWE